MKTVALVGFSANTMHRWKDLPADVPIWTVNCAWRHGIDRIDRLFDMHDPDYYQRQALHQAKVEREQNRPRSQDAWEAEHLQWLAQEHDFPIYLLEPHRNVPSGVRYPVNDVLEYLYADIEHPPYMTCSFSWMLGLAMLEGYERVHVVGFDMGSMTEYAYQKSGAEYLMGRAEGMGVRFVLPKESWLLNSRLYGYEPMQMVSRQTLEYHLTDYGEQLKNNRELMAKAEGMVEALQAHIVNANGDKAVLEAELETAKKERGRYANLAIQCEGAQKAVKQLIWAVDSGEEVKEQADG